MKLDKDGNLVYQDVSISLDSNGNLQYNPIKKKKKKEEEQNSWINTSTFDDGYQIGDITKTILGTTADTGASILKGVWDTGQNISKAGVGFVAQVSDWMGNDEYANKLRNRLGGKDEEVNKRLENIDIFGNAQKELKDSSVLGTTTESILSGVGNFAGMAAAQSVGVPWQVTAGLSSAGAGLEEAYKNDATNSEAWTSAAVDAAAEIFSEYIFGGLKLPGTGKTTEKMIGGLTNKISSKMFKGLTEFGINALGEGAEEVISGSISALGKKLTYMSDKELNEIYSNEDKLNDFVSGALTTVIANGVSPGTYKDIKAGRSLITGKTVNEQNVIDSLVEERIKEAEKNGEKYSKKKIEQQVEEDLANGYIDLDTIEKSLGGENYTKYQAELQKQEDIQKEIDKLENMKANDMTVKQQEELKSLREELETTNKSLSGLRSDLSSYVNDLTQNDALIRNSYDEYFKKGNAYNTDLTKIDEKYRDTYKRAIDSGVLNNTRRSHDFIDLLAKLENEKGVKFDFTNNEKLKDSLFALKDKQVNGFVNGDTITLNMDSNKALNQVVGHEITHILEGTELYQDLQNAVKEYATTKGIYETKLNDLRELYKEVKDANIENELTSDLVGEYLFTDEDFVRRLSTQNRNLFQKIYDEIKYLSKLITSGSKEGRQLEKLKHTFEKAYRTTTENQNTDTKFSIAGINGINNLQDSKFKRDALSAYNEAQERAKNKEDNESIRKATKWYQDKNGDWKFEIDDSSITLDNNLIQKNGEYKLGEIIEHPMLFKLYPELKDYDIKFENMNANGAFLRNDNLIKVNNEFIDKANYKELKGTILHEVQHAIQKIEGFERGMSSKLSKKAYYEKLGEIEANDTKQRYINDMDKSAREQIAPESSKEKPKHTKYDEYMNNRKTFDKIKDNIYPIVDKLINKGESNVNNEDIQENKRQDSNLVVGRELDNSSFSLDKNAKRYEDLEKTSYIEYFVKDNGDVRINMMDSNNNLVNQFDLYNQREAINQLGEKLGKQIYQTSSVDNQRINIGNDINNLGKENDYFMSHRPTETGITADDLIKQGYEVGLPNDIYEHPEYYSVDETTAKETMEQLKKVRNNPNADVTIYRATTGDKINKGDWITLSRSYAELHNNSQFDGKGNIVEKIVKAKDIQHAGDVLEEWGYFPNSKYSISNQNEDIAPIGNYNIKGEDIKLQDIAPIETKQEVKETTKPKVETPTKEEIELPFDYDEPLEINGLDDKTINKITKNLKSELSLNPYETREFKSILSDISKNDSITKEEITNIIEKKFGEKEIKTRIDEIAEIKKELRKTKIFVPDYVKVDIPDYSDFRQRNYGKINFSKEGMAVDKVYDELAEMFPQYFSKDITSESDQLQEIARIANLDKYVTDTAYLDESKIENAANWIYDSIEDYDMQQQVKQGTLGYNEYLEKSKQKEMKKTRKMVQNELQDEMGITVDDLEFGKDISSLGYQRTDPIRLNEKVFGAKVGKKINDATIRKTNHNEAERTRFLNKEREEIKNLGIKARSKESAAVQKYGEKQYVKDNGEIVPYTDADLAREFPSVATQNKIKNAAKVIRAKYDTYIDEINKSITSMGYDPIPKRPDYMRHFQEINDKLSEWGIPLNRDSMSKDTLPTDINGVTDQFKPGKNWFASAMQRKGLKTTYDAITGIDGYLEGASNLMFHTADIQRYRTLSKMIRDTYGQTHGLDNIDLNTKEGQQRLNNIYDNKLSKYAVWLDEQANALAGKKGGIDRAAERLLGRKIYTIADTAKKQVGSNMTGFNVRSALTNFASAVQGASKTNKIAFIKGTISTVKNMIRNDGLIEKSDFLTNRFGSDNLSKKLWQKASNAGQILMTGSDYFTANQIWRSKYYENLSNGMSETEAIKSADDFSSRIMGDRSKGMTAEIFNSKTLGLLTQFQLEVNNQWSSIVHDNKIDVQSGNKSGATVMFQLGQLAAMSYMFNNFMKAVTGSDVMLDPIDILKELFGANDDDDEETTLEERSQKVLGDLVNNLPFASIMTGGRIPIAEAFTGAGTAFNKLTGKTDKYGNEITWDDVKNDVISSAAYWLLPTGYGQIKKTTKGLSMYDDKLPVAGSYTDSGNLRFTADDSTGGKIQAALFGEYSQEEARKYRDSGYQTVNKNNIQELLDLNMNASEYRKYKEDLKNAGTKNSEKIDFISNSNYTDKQKNIMAENVLGKEFNMKNYKNYGSYEEADYAIKNPDKYLTSKVVSNTFDNYKNYANTIKDIKSDETATRKEKIINYIDNLNEDYGSKIILYKMYYPKDNSYNADIVEYLNNSNKISLEEEKKILSYLGMEITDDGTVRW